MVDLNPLHLFSKKKTGPTEMEWAVTNALAVAEQGRSTSEAEREKQLAENSLLMLDQDLEHLVTGMCTYDAPVIEPSTGAFKVDASGDTVTQKGVIPKYVAVRILQTPLIRGSYLDPQDVILGKIRTRCILRRVKMKMTEGDYENGGALILDAVNQISDVNYSCAKHGRMALVTKSVPKSMEVRVGKASDVKS